MQNKAYHAKRQVDQFVSSKIAAQKTCPGHCKRHYCANFSEYEIHAEIILNGNTEKYDTAGYWHKSFQ